MPEQRIFECEFCRRPFVDKDRDYQDHVGHCRDAAQRELDDKWFKEQREASKNA